MFYKLGRVIARGKTKRVLQTDQRGVVVLENLPSITAFDDSSVTKEFDTKAVAATTTTCRVFELLKAAGIPVAFIEQVSSTSFAAMGCGMLPYEAVARRYAVGSYLKRHPEMAETAPPYRFRCLVTELFLKTTKGKVVLTDGQEHDLSLDPENGEEDPLLVKEDGRWILYHAKKPGWVVGARLGTLALGDLPCEHLEEIDNLLRRVFMVLEAAWAQLGWRFIDLKIEFGIDIDGNLVVADVIDNDSWRLRDINWKEMSKQVFRDQISAGAVDLDEVAWLYDTVAMMTSQFRIPEQAIVLWLGSRSDEEQVVKAVNDQRTIRMPAGVSLVEVIGSGHRETAKVLGMLSLIERQFTGGVVIIDLVGLSNGLGPILSAHTSCPVISVPLTPEDAPSSLRLPGKVPASTMLGVSNALHQAVQILGLNNPAAYAAARMLAETDMGLPTCATFSDIAMVMAVQE